MKKLTQSVMFSLVVWMAVGAISNVNAQDAGVANTNTAPVTAPIASEKHHHKWACGADIKTLCPDAKTRKEKMKCLKENKDKVSGACKAQMEKMHSKMAALKEACSADVAQFCVDAKGHKAIHQCLEKNESSLSDSCKAARAKMHKAWKKHHHRMDDAAKSEQPQVPASQPAQQ